MKNYGMNFGGAVSESKIYKIYLIKLINNKFLYYQDLLLSFPLYVLIIGTSDYCIVHCQKNLWLLKAWDMNCALENFNIDETVFTINSFLAELFTILGYV